MDVLEPIVLQEEAASDRLGSCVKCKKKEPISLSPEPENYRTAREKRVDFAQGGPTESMMSSYDNNSTGNATRRTFYTNSSSESYEYEIVPHPIMCHQLVQCIALLCMLLVLIVTSACMFYAIEQVGTELPFSDPCISNPSATNDAAEMIIAATRQNATAEDVRKIIAAHNDKLFACQRETKKIDTFQKALVFSWSLTSTVGYGDTHPQTAQGRGMAILYTALALSLYLGVKAEFGKIIANEILKVLFKVKEWYAKIRKKDSAAHPKDWQKFVFIALLAYGMMFMIAAIQLLYEHDWNYADSLYFTGITSYLVGLGDIAPNNRLCFIFISIPLFLLNDTALAFVNFFLQDFYRDAIGRLFDRLCGADDDTSIVEYPSITKSTLPLDKVCPTCHASGVTLHRRSSSAVDLVHSNSDHKTPLIRLDSLYKEEP